MSFSLLLSAVLLATSTSASPFTDKRAQPQNSFSLKISHKANVFGNMNGVIARDRARVQSLLCRSNCPNQQNSGQNNPAPGNNVTSPILDAGFLALIEVGVGSPPTSYTLIVDTGSSNTFVGASTPYVRTNSSQDTGEAVAVSYGSGSFSGEEFLDDVTLGTTTIINQSIGVANKSQGFNGLDGILGLGPDSLTEGTLINNPSTIPTVTDNLASQYEAAAPLVGVSIPLTLGNGSSDGSLDFGVPDTSKFNNDLAFVPVTSTFPSSLFWGIDQSITYGNASIPILNTTAGIVDTGTTFLYMATEAFNAYVAATGATLDANTGLLTIANPNNLQSLFFNMDGTTLEFTANAQIFPRSLNAQIGGQSGATYLIIQDNGPLGQGVEFINGFTFLQRFYSVFDTSTQKIGFATTPQTTAVSN